MYNGKVYLLENAANLGAVRLTTLDVKANKTVWKAPFKNLSKTFKHSQIMIEEVTKKWLRQFFQKL